MANFTESRIGAARRVFDAAMSNGNSLPAEQQELAIQSQTLEMNFGRGVTQPTHPKLLGALRIIRDVHQIAADTKKRPGPFAFSEVEKKLEKEGLSASTPAERANQVTSLNTAYTFDGKAINDALARQDALNRSNS